MDLTLEEVNRSWMGYLETNTFPPHICTEGTGSLLSNNTSIFLRETPNNRSWADVVMVSFASKGLFEQLYYCRLDRFSACAMFHSISYIAINTVNTRHTTSRLRFWPCLGLSQADMVCATLWMVHLIMYSKHLKFKMIKVHRQDDV